MKSTLERKRQALLHPLATARAIREKKRGTDIVQGVDTRFDLAKLVGKRDSAQAPIDRIVEAIVQHMQLRARAVCHRQFRPGRQAFYFAHRLVGELLRLLALAAAPVQARKPAQIAGDLVNASKFSPNRNGAVSRLDNRIIDEQRQSSLISPVLIELGCNRRRGLSSVFERGCQMRGRLPMRAQTRGLCRSLRREFKNARAVVGIRRRGAPDVKAWQLSAPREAPISPPRPSR